MFEIIINDLSYTGKKDGNFLQHGHGEAGQFTHREHDEQHLGYGELIHHPLR
jgi:hypothetical protein